MSQLRPMSAEEAAMACDFLDSLEDQPVTTKIELVLALIDSTIDGCAQYCDQYEHEVARAIAEGLRGLRLTGDAPERGRAEATLNARWRH